MIKNEYFLRISYIVLLGFGFPIMRFMSIHFDTLNNNAIRFLSGGFFLIMLSLVCFKNELKKVKISYWNISKVGKYCFCGP